MILKSSIQVLNELLMLQTLMKHLMTKIKKFCYEDLIAIDKNVKDNIKIF